LGEQRMLDRRKDGDIAGRRLSVPTKATISSGQKSVTSTMAMPVPIISIEATRNSERLPKRCATNPTASVRVPEPSSVAVITSPTSNAL
jgi:hypothetical protein